MLGKLLRFLAWAVGLIVVAIFSGWFTMNALIKGEEIKVPDLIGKTTDEAYKLLSDAGLYLTKAGEQPDDRVSPGRIISQDPSPGTTMKKNRKVRVVVSSGSETVTVPDLVEKSSRTAPIVLKEAGLQIGMTAQTSSERVATGEIVSQEPRGGTEELRDNTVNVLISTGPRATAYVMPDLIGKDVKQVAPILRHLGFQIGNIRSQNYPGLKPGVIIKQIPLAGYEIQKEKLISLEVSQE
ncbi:MAG: PASTA domain-containing protein [Acidobacteria bacterium]|nr:PASTA domain-containing protein [Acidobacteriota bacterium]